MKRFCLSLLLLVVWAPLLPAQSTIFLVRHAEKADPPPDNPKDPELSPAGRARADVLAETLRDAGIRAVYATEYKRTQQTAAPLAQAAAVEVTIVPANETATLVAQLKKAPGHVLVVGHSNTIPEILQALGAKDDVTLEESDYDNLFILPTADSPKVIRLHLGSPKP